MHFLPCKSMPPPQKPQAESSRQVLPEHPEPTGDLREEPRAPPLRVEARENNPARSIRHDGRKRQGRRLHGAAQRRNHEEGVGGRGQSPVPCQAWPSAGDSLYPSWEKCCTPDASSGKDIVAHLEPRPLLAKVHVNGSGTHQSLPAACRFPFSVNFGSWRLQSSNKPSPLWSKSLSLASHKRAPHDGKTLSEDPKAI